ncbi:PREDICTED: putative cysteine-rich receptor-like protein kinase 39 isoform X2 [Camelina sativa]|uniref:Cysteine-rich receptor-like protein kinase 39 isoform X2 n=1 Tax=Camelina sativa TaxID=90675 RepID=A0ABM0VF78_CAMSA|nr:PREDICTED: putative cysteine-rich receptor-like protein kinase 39 isoform X2 [Camelina sativa]
MITHDALYNSNLSLFILYIVLILLAPHMCLSCAYQVCLFSFLLVGNAEYSDLDGQFMLRFDLDMIVKATDGFSSENKLGQGGFSTVYKGTLLNGKEIAVKRLTRGSGQGDMEFKNEVSLLTRLQHRNLVKLLGFCNEGDKEVLVYEFVPKTPTQVLITLSSVSLFSKRHGRDGLKESRRL